MDSAMPRLPQKGKKKGSVNKLLIIGAILALVILVGEMSYLSAEKTGSDSVSLSSRFIGKLSAILNNSSDQNSSNITQGNVLPVQTPPSAPNPQMSPAPGNLAPAAPLSSAVVLGKTYSNTAFNYSIKYPNDWIYEYRSDGSIIFSGPENTPAYDSTVEITKTAGNSIDDVCNGIKADYAGDAAAKAQIANDQQYSYLPSGGNKVEGKSFEVTYTDTANGNTTYHDLVATIPQNGGYYVWTYSSPQNQYDTDLKTAQAMLGSWVINK